MGHAASPVAHNMDPAVQPEVRVTLAEAGQFIRTRWLTLVAWSGAIVIPCVWHRRIAAGDLGSHVYNAWLAELITKGEVPGLQLATQWNNVLFDWLLSMFARMLGYVGAEKLAVALAVLVLFWGIFVFCGAVARKTPTFLTPAIAMIAYGWTFHAGFFNYYLAIGFSFWALAIGWRLPGAQKLLALPCAALTFVAHPLGFAWLVGAALYLALASRLRWRTQLLLLALAGVILGCVRVFAWLQRYYMIRAYFPWPLINGADQLLLGTKYYLPALAAAAIGIVALVLDARQRRADGGFWARHGIALQLYAITLFVVWTQPTLIYLPNYTAPISFMLERVSLVSAVLGCAVLAAIRPRCWHAWSFGAVAMLFFGFVYRDTAILNRMEQRIEELVRTIPAGVRVLGRIPLFEAGSRMAFNDHMLDRACIGHCFAYGNYEASTNQFRVRARQRNRFVLISDSEVVAAATGNYLIRDDEPPIYQIEPTRTDPLDFQVRALAPGEKNGQPPGDQGRR